MLDTFRKNKNYVQMVKIKKQFLSHAATTLYNIMQSHWKARENCMVFNEFVSREEESSNLIDCVLAFNIVVTVHFCPSMMPWCLH